MGNPKNLTGGDGPHKKIPCPGCGETFGSLPIHIPKCDMIDHDDPQIP